MELVETDVTENPGYVSCMFCTARCFKLHGGGLKGSKSHGVSSSSVPATLPGPERSTSRKHPTPFFVKTVKTTTVRRKNCELHLPAFFFRDYGDRFQNFVLLRGPNGQVWPVKLCVSCGSSAGRATVRFSRGWKEFASDHDLDVGDKLIFTLISFSRFSVQVYDPFGKNKQTSSKAVSAWSFRREGLSDGVLPREKKSIFVNWKDKIIREFTSNSLSEESKKSKVVGNRPTKMSLLHRHLKRKDKSQEAKIAGTSKFRARNSDEGLPVCRLGQKWIKQIDSARSSTSEAFLNSKEVAGGENESTNLFDRRMVKWEPLENTPSLQVKPLVGKTSVSPKALASTQQVVVSNTEPVRLQKVTILSSSAANRPDILEHRARGRYSFVEQPEDKEERLHSYWNHSEKSSSFVASQTDEDITHMAKPPLPNDILDIRPMSALESPHDIDVLKPPTLPTLSFSHYLGTQPLEEAIRANCHESRRFKSFDTRMVSRNHFEKNLSGSEGCSDSPVLISESLASQTRSQSQVQGHANSSKQRMLREGVSTHRMTSISDDARAFTSRSVFERTFDLSNGEDHPKHVGSQTHSCGRNTCEDSSFPTCGIRHSSKYIKVKFVKSSTNTSEKIFSVKGLDLKSKSTWNPGFAELESDTPRKTIDSATKLGKQCPSRTHRLPLSTPSRSDLSLAYFLNQPRLNARPVDREDDAAAARHTSGGSFAGTKKSSTSEIDQSAATVIHSLQNGQKDSANTTVFNTVSAPLEKCKDVKPSEGLQAWLDEQRQGLEMTGLLTACQIVCPSEQDTVRFNKSAQERSQKVMRSVSLVSGSISAASPADDGSSPASVSPMHDFEFPDDRVSSGEARDSKTHGADDRKRPLKRGSCDKGASEVTQRKSKLQKGPTSISCTILHSLNQEKPASHQRAVCVTEYLQQKRVAKKMRPRLKRNAAYHDASAEQNVYLDPGDGNDTKLCVIRKKFQACSASKIMRDQIINISDARQSASRGEKVQKLGGMLNVIQHRQATRIRDGIRDKCDLDKLDRIASGDESPLVGEVKGSWDTWMDII